MDFFADDERNSLLDSACRKILSAVKPNLKPKGVVFYIENEDYRINAMKEIDCD